MRLLVLGPCGFNWPKACTFLKSNHSVWMLCQMKPLHLLFLCMGLVLICLPSNDTWHNLLPLLPHHPPRGECIHEKCNKHSTRAQTIWQTLVLDESLWGWNVLQIHWFGTLSSPSYYSTIYAKKWKPRALPVDEIVDLICPCPYDIWCWGRDEAIHVCMHNHTWKNIPLIRSILRRWKCQLISGVPCIKLLT